MHQEMCLIFSSKRRRLYINDKSRQRLGRFALMDIDSRKMINPFASLHQLINNDYAKKISSMPGVGY